MNRYDYENLLSKIKLLEIKSNRIQFEKEFLHNTKPLFFEFEKKKKWIIRFQAILLKEKETNVSLENAYSELEKLLNTKKKK